MKRVTHIEKYQYKSAPKNTKRYNSPWTYGKRVICMEIVDENTGEKSGVNGEFIHGTNKPQSIGKYASLGCIRMNNNAVVELSEKLNARDYVLFMR